MRAMVIPEFGDHHVLQLRETAIPLPGPGEITIDVAFAGVNYAEVLFRKGGVPELPLPFVPGIEVSGTVRALGEGVTGFRPGQPVAALTIVNGGGYAEVVKVKSTLAFPLDEALAAGMSLAQAAAFPSNSTTAYFIVKELSRLRQDETVLVHAAAGGVGGVIGQTLKRLGASRIIGTVGSPDKIGIAKALGYDDVLLRQDYYKSVLDITGGAGVDVVIDPVGGQMRHEGLQLLKPFGRMITMGNASGEEDVLLSANGLWFSNKAVLGFNLQQMSAIAPDLVSSASRHALRLAAEGDVSIHVTGILDLEEAGEAHRRIEERSTTGKLVLRING